jgi:hypothetical protein
MSGLGPSLRLCPSMSVDPSSGSLVPASIVGDVGIWWKSPAAASTNSGSTPV